MKSCVYALVACASLLAGCATRSVPSKLYNMNSGNVLSASFDWAGTLSGPVVINRDDEVCVGEYRTIQEGRDGVGLGVAGGPWGALFGAVSAGSSVERAQKGIAVAMCPSKHTFECEYITNVGMSGVSGHGACRDNRGQTYRLMF